MDKKKLKIILLIAGQGKRIRNLTNLPKCFLKINKKSILERNIENFQKLKTSNVVLVTGYKSDLIKKILHKNDLLNFNIKYNKFYKEYGNSYSIYLALSSINYDKTVILDGDLIYDFKILKNFILQDNKNSVLVGNGSIKDIECAKVLVKKNKTIHKIIDKSGIRKSLLKKVKFVGEAPGMIKFNKNGLVKFKNSLKKFFKLKKNIKLNWEHAINYYCLNNQLYYFKTKSNKWIEVDNLNDYKKALKKFS